MGNLSPYYSPNDGAPSWQYLKDHYRKHLKPTASTVTSGAPRYRIISTDYPTLGTRTIQGKPSKELLIPVIAKLQIMFSMVSHWATDPFRQNAYTQYGDPKDYKQHAIPHIVYDPVFTLYNPYDVELEVNQLRIRISDPPIGFQFQKHDVTAGTDPWYRSEFGSGAYHGLGSFQIASEGNPTARKEFIFLLKDKAGSPGAPMVLAPGEVKVYSAFVENNWTWDMETKSGPRAFFDWQLDKKFGLKDNRGEPKGVMGAAGIDWRAGLQTDHMSYGDANRRPKDSRYPWEVETQNPLKLRPGMGEGWVSLKRSDSITVNCRPQRIATGSNPDFRVDVMAGNGTGEAVTDVIRTFEFRLSNVETDLFPPGVTGKIERK
ncbi:MAG: hypothetical protein EOP84_32935, partial [Verrucomicrobiaceae bacterium]